MEEALKRMVCVADEAKKMHEFMTGSGYSNTPYTKIYDDVADAIYYMIGEDKAGYDTFDQSVTYQVLNSDLDNSAKARLLLGAYRQVA